MKLINRAERIDVEPFQRPNQQNNHLIDDNIGKPVVNAYGWMVGKVIGCSTDFQNGKSFLGIELASGGFARLEISKANYDKDSIKIDLSWRQQAEILAENSAKLMKKIVALNEMKSEIKENIYADLQNRFEKEKKALLDLEQNLTEKLEERQKIVNAQLNEVYEFTVNLKIGYHLGEIKEEIYQSSSQSLQGVLERLQTEESDIKFALDKLSHNTSTILPEPLKSFPTYKPDQPLNEPIRLRLIPE